jgi:drug/metabolite transporter (DMT)-like permease
MILDVFFTGLIIAGSMLIGISKKIKARSIGIAGIVMCLISACFFAYEIESKKNVQNNCVTINK